LGVAPWAAFDEHCVQPCLAGGQDVVVESVADVGDLPWRKSSCCDEFVEERRSGFSAAQSAEVAMMSAGRLRFVYELTGPGGLVPGDADEVAVFFGIQQSRTSG
jgi:hypothetical protein